MTVAEKLGFRVLPSPPRLSSAILNGFADLSSATVADAMGRFNFMDFEIRCRSGKPLCGLAVTVNTRPGDNLMVHKAIDVAQPGDLLVVMTHGGVNTAVFGDLMCRAAAAKKLGGIVVDGAIRDVEGITSIGFPAFSRAVSPGSCDKDGPGEVNVPIACGGAVVMPGDIVIGDADGVVVVPRDRAEEVLALAKQTLEREKVRIAEIEKGVIVKEEIDATLRKKGVIS
jgi:regulator of RNase E activity RraA